MNRKKGLIIKLTGGWYTVIEEDTHERFACRARGVFRHQDVSPKVGDHVFFDVLDHQNGYIMEVLPRRNNLTRPYIANVDKALLVFSVKKPDFNSNLLDRFLAVIEFNDIETVILFNKIDLLNDDDTKSIEIIRHYYESIGYKTLMTSIKSFEIGVLTKEIQGHVCVVSGQSGVGKSSLLNAMDITLNIKTDEISEALGRGKHTTRHVELIPMEGGWIADTPGFGLLEFTGMTTVDLSHSFREFFKVGKDCRFHGCIHENEPGCAVKKAVEKGDILNSRYENYLSFLGEIQAQTKNKY